VLARLQDVEGVSHAAVDYGGNHLRLTLDEPGALEAAMALLRELGYAPELAAPGEARPAKWYDVESVVELSAIEAEVIARRVARKFTTRTPLSRDVAGRLESAVAAALRQCFTDRDAGPDAKPGEFRKQCLEAAAVSARDMLDGAQVADFVRTLEADLNEDHTHDAGI